MLDCVPVSTVSQLVEELIVQTQKEKPSLNLTEEQVSILKRSMTEKLIRCDRERLDLLDGR